MNDKVAQDRATPDTAHKVMYLCHGVCQEGIPLPYGKYELITDT